MEDVIIAGAGPAGSMAGLLLARAGLRVLIVDRDEFPRDKLCGDTLNPGAVALLASLGLDTGPVAGAARLSGMVVTGPHARIEARYGGSTAGRALRRYAFDQFLLQNAIAAGATFAAGLVVRAPLVEGSGAASEVQGLLVAKRGEAKRAFTLRSRMTIAADGRRSVVGRALGLTWQPAAHRRWAVGTYLHDVSETSDLGEMHIRGRSYLGIAPMGDGTCNVCAVTGAWPAGRSPIDVLHEAIRLDAHLRERFVRARPAGPVRVLGPLAVQAQAFGLPGLLLAGDAAGFVDPMTGDGLHLAMQGAVLAARAAIRALSTGDRAGAVTDLTRARHEVLAPKQRFNHVLRRLVDTPWAVEAAGWGATIAPALVRWAVRRAGDAA